MRRARSKFKYALLHRPCSLGEPCLKVHSKCNTAKYFRLAILYTVTTEVEEAVLLLVVGVLSLRHDHTNQSLACAEIVGQRITSTFDKQVKVQTG